MGRWSRRIARALIAVDRGLPPLPAASLRGGLAGGAVEAEAYREHRRCLGLAAAFEVPTARRG